MRYKDCKVGEDRRVRYDRIVCDVPCSSDAAIRKIPTKWLKWNTKDSQSLHPLQIQILQRGIELLKVGGKITYSTCSLNVIENEAVVAAILKQYKGKIRLVPSEERLAGFQFQKGLTSWDFLNLKPKEQLGPIEEKRKSGDLSESFFDEYKSVDEVPQDMRTHIRETMFMSNYSEEVLAELPKCLRVMPHIQNTSGFFITCIEKIAEMDGDEPDLETEDKSDVKPPSVIQNDNRMKDFSYFRCDLSDPDVEYI